MDLWRIDSVQIITIKWGKKERERKRAHTHRHEMLFGENKELGETVSIHSSTSTY